MRKRILIMGGARFHGFMLAQKLAAEGHQVTVLNRGKYRIKYPENIEHLKADRSDGIALSQAMQEREFETVFDNNGYNSHQVRMLLCLLRGRIEQYIFTSSAAVYLKLTADREFKEDEARGILRSPFSPKVRPYALNKFAAEEVIRSEFSAVNYTILRFPNIFGAGDFSGKLSYFHHRFLNGGGVLLEREVGKFSLICVQDAVEIMSACRNNEKCYGKTLNAAEPKVYDYDEFFSGAIAESYDSSKKILAPAAEVWEKGYHLPLAWGVSLDVSGLRTMMNGFQFTPVKHWGKEALAWERDSFGDRMKEEKFRQERELELKIIRELG